MRRVLLASLALLCACKGEAEPEVPDAGPTVRSLGAAEVGVFVTLPTGWVEDRVEAQPAAHQESSPAIMSREVRTVATARRVSTGKSFLVAKSPWTLRPRRASFDNTAPRLSPDALLND